MGIGLTAGFAVVGLKIEDRSAAVDVAQTCAAHVAFELVGGCELTLTGTDDCFLVCHVFLILNY